MVFCAYSSLDLDKWINEPPKESSEEEEDIEDMFGNIEHRLEQPTIVLVF